MHSDRNLSFRGALLAAAIALAGVVACAQAQTYSFRVVHAFTGEAGDASGLYAPVLFDRAGNMYGTTTSGGAYGLGAIFKIARDGTETVVHSFDGVDGRFPNTLTVDPATGDLYGTTNYGGTGCTMGCGVLYKLTTRGAFTVLHYFDAIGGSGPDGPLLRDPQGNLYGTALYGGNGPGDGYGTVFKYGADGRFTVLHAFTGTDSLNPAGGVIRDRVGNLYGTTMSYWTDGPKAPASVYKLAPEGTLTTLHWFNSYARGGLVGDDAGNLYGATEDESPQFDSALFKIDANGSYTTIHTFRKNAAGMYSNGIYPNGDLLLLGGNLYGTTQEGGDYTCFFNGRDRGCGTVFKLAMDGSGFTVLHAFASSDLGVAPRAGLAYRNGRLYGTTSNGFLGTIFGIGVTR